MRVTLDSITDVIRSKNAGPYELTFDIMFTTREWFERIAAAGVFNTALICRLYRIPPKMCSASSPIRRPRRSRSRSAGRSARAISVKPMSTAPSSTRPCWTWLSTFRPGFCYTRKRCRA